jgi:ATP-dependent RNA helicase RhlE
VNFESFHLDPCIESGIKALGYTVPTPIQLQSIPSILQGRDFMGVAQTGTGKTAAFALPILQRLMAGPRKQVRALIMAPTRELAEQTHEAFSRLGRHTEVKSATIYGGVDKNSQIRKLRGGSEIAVACPGRLIDLMDQRAINLSHVEVLVLDEADRMFDMGFLPDIRNILKRLPVQRQTLLFSATMPGDIRDLARDILRDPIVIQIGKSVPVSTVSHSVYPVEAHLKTALLMRILHRTDMGSVLIFTRTKHRATRLAEQMKRAGFPVTSLQGDLPQHKRQRALHGFRSGVYRILVATDIAARGIDVSRISHVINYDMPETVDGYTHRIGRTGRAAKTGDAFTFVTRKESALLWGIENVLGEKLKTRMLEDFDYSLPAPESSGGLRLSRYPEKRQRSPKLTSRSRENRSSVSPAGILAPSGISERSKSPSNGRSFVYSARPRARRSGTIRSF